MIHEVQSFGARLKAERERRGISLDSIAEQTKIKRSFLDGLERGDFSRWPTGEVFRRAYIRDYAAAIGLAPEPVLVEFIRLALVSADTKLTPEWAPLTITFDNVPGWRRHLTSRAVGGALLDATGLLACGSVLALLTGTSIWATSGVLAFAYYPATTVLWGRSAGAQLLDARRLLRRGPVTSVAAVGTVIAEAPLHGSLGRLEGVEVDPLLLASPDVSMSAHVQRESPAH